jgi:hypothetical protein
MVSIDWSLVLNIVSVPAAIYFAWKAHSSSKEQRAERKREELALMNSRLDRISSIEHASRAGTFQYQTLINDGVFSNNIVNEIVSKCRKYNVDGAQLAEFENIANSALANRDWNKQSASELIRAATNLKNAVESI